MEGRFTMQTAVEKCLLLCLACLLCAFSIPRAVLAQGSYDLDSKYRAMNSPVEVTETFTRDSREQFGRIDSRLIANNGSEQNNIENSLGLHGVVIDSDQTEVTGFNDCGIAIAELQELLIVQCAMGGKQGRASSRSSFRFGKMPGASG